MSEGKKKKTLGIDVPCRSIIQCSEKTSERDCLQEETIKRERNRIGVWWVSVCRDLRGSFLAWRRRAWARVRGRGRERGKRKKRPRCPCSGSCIGGGVSGRRKKSGCEGSWRSERKRPPNGTWASRLGNAKRWDRRRCFLLGPQELPPSFSLFSLSLCFCSFSVGLKWNGRTIDGIYVLFRCFHERPCFISQTHKSPSVAAD